MAIKDDDLLYVQRPSGTDAGSYKIEAGDLLESPVDISSTAPSPAKEGDLWWADTDLDDGGGRLYVYTGSEWVDTSLPGNALDVDTGDTRYLSRLSDDNAKGAITFEGLTTHEAGVRVTGGGAAATPGLYSSDGNNIRLTSAGTINFILNSTTQASITSSGRFQKSVNGLTPNTTGMGIRVNGALPLDVGSTESSYFIAQPEVATGHAGPLVSGFKSQPGNDLESIGSYRGFYHFSNPDIASKTYGFYSQVGGGGTDGNNFNFYANSPVPNFFAGDTFIGGTTAAPNISLNSSGLGVFGGGVKVTGGDLLVNPGRVIVQSTEAQGITNTIQDANTNSIIRAYSCGSQSSANADEIYAFATRDTFDDAKATTRKAAFYCEVSKDGGINYNFYAGGDAPNYFGGVVKNASYIQNRAAILCQKKTNGSLAADDFSDQVINPRENKKLGASIRNEGQVLAFLGTSLDGWQIGRQDNGQLLAFFNSANTNIGQFGVSGGSLIQPGASDYRLKNNIVDLPNVTDKIKQLRPVTFELNGFEGYTHTGFIAHEVQETFPEAVFGEKDETEAIGTLTDWDGTVLETDVTEPDDLEYTEEVETDGVATMVTRTRSWTPSGTRPVYQGVDQTKLIPLLTKALQEALERIEQLEADHATMMNNNSGGSY